MTSMRSSFVEWLCSYVLNAGLVRLIEGMLGILALASGLSALFGTAAIKAGAVVALMIGNVGLIAVLVADRMSRSGKAELHQELLERYCTVLFDGFNFAWRVSKWAETVVIRKNGDARVTILVTATVECDSLYFFKFYRGPRWDQPASQRRKIRPDVRSVEVNGVGGARQPVTMSWVPGAVQFIVHFREPLSRGTEISMVVEIDWPGMCLPLMRRGAADEFTVTPACLMDRLDYTVVLPAGLDAYCELLGFVRGVDEIECTRNVGNTGRGEIRLVARNLAAGRRIGMVLDRKERGTRRTGHAGRALTAPVD